MIAEEFAREYQKYLDDLKAHLNKHRADCSQEQAARLLERINDFKTFVEVLRKIETEYAQKA